MSKKICHITTAHKVFDTRIFQRQCRSLAKAGFDVTLVARHDREEIVNGVRILPLPSPKTKLLRRLVLPFAAVNRIVHEGFDLFHFHDPELFPAMLWLRLRTRKPVIWDAHEYHTGIMYHLNQFGWKPLSWLGSRLFEIFEIWSSKKCFSSVVTVSNIMAARYEKQGIPTTVVGNYMELDPNEPEQFGSIQKASPPRFVASPSQMTDRYGAFVIFEAFKRVHAKKPCQLAYWSQFPNAETERKLRTDIALADLENVVTIAGPHERQVLLNELLPTATAAMILFLPLENPNYRVGIPNRLAEYWSRKLPVIVSHQTNMASLVEKANGGLIVDNSPEQVANAFEYFLNHPDRARQMGENGYEYFKTFLNWNTAFANLEGLYHHVLQKTH